MRSTDVRYIFGAIMVERAFNVAEIDTTNIPCGWRFNNLKYQDWVMEFKTEGRRSIGRPRLRWLDGVVQNTRRTGVEQWWMVAVYRESWRRK